MEEKRIKLLDYICTLVNPGYRYPLRTARQRLHGLLQNSYGFFNVVVHDGQIKIVSVRRFQKCRFFDQSLQTSVVLRSRNEKSDTQSNKLQRIQNYKWRRRKVKHSYVIDILNGWCGYKHDKRRILSSAQHFESLRFNVQDSHFAVSVYPSYRFQFCTIHGVFVGS